MKHSFKTGFTFGFTSAIITTLGLMVGLHAGTQSRLAVIGGILVIAIADAFSDALGIHMAEEAENIHTAREIWEATIATFFSKFTIAITFVLPLLLLDFTVAIVVSVAWGFSLLAIFSWVMARQQGQKPWKVVGEHLLIAVVVSLATHYVGEVISSLIAGMNS